MLIPANKVYNNQSKEMDCSFTLHGPHLEPIHKTLPDLLLSKAEEHEANGKTTYVIDGLSGESFTFKQFQNLSRNIASAMFKRGLKKGDTVAYMLFDVAKLHLFFMGIWRANGSVRGIYPEELQDSVKEVIMESKVKWLFCDPSLLDVCSSAAKEVPWNVDIITMGRAPHHDSIYDLFADDGSACPKLEIGPNDPAILMCTSGTTGRSKGAVYLHRQLAASSILGTWVFPLTKNKPNFILGKPAHISAVAAPLSIFIEGHVSLLIPHLSNDNILQGVINYKPGYIFGFPAFLTNLIGEGTIEKFDKNCIEAIVVSGTTIAPTLENELKSKLPNLKEFGIGYGATECAPVSMAHGKAQLEYQITKFPNFPPTSVGKLAPGCSLQIKDSELNILGPNQEGEICLKSVAMFNEYFHMPKETQEAFTADGYFRTGDMGYVDENGFIFHVGRNKEMFKCAGNHVYPSQIDEIIFKHEAVEHACTIGISDPNGGSEKIARAFVTLKPGKSATAEEILTFAHKNLPSYKHLKGGLYILPEFPRGSSGKITRLLVAKLSVPPTSN